MCDAFANLFYLIKSWFEFKKEFVVFWIDKIGNYDYTIGSILYLPYFLMKQIHTALIGQIQDERVPTPDELVFINKSLWNILSIATLPSKKISLQKYIIPIPQNATREYIPDLENARMSMKNNYKDKNIPWLIKDIDYIIDNYHQSLWYSDIFDIYLFLIHTTLQSNDNEAMVLLKYIQRHESKLSWEQQMFFWIYLWTAYFWQGEITQNATYYQQANMIFEKILNIRDNVLDDTIYIHILHKNILSLYKLLDNDIILQKISDFLEFCGWDPIKKTYKQKYIEYVREMFFMQWSTYEFIPSYDEAIKAYENYLIVDPNNSYVQTIIASLQSKKTSQ